MPGSSFLDEEIEKYRTKNGYLHQQLPTKKGSNLPFTIDDIEGNNKQEQVVYTVLKKLKEWVEFPAKHKRDNSVSFSPLRLTVMGVGGTGKSFLISVIVTILKQLVYEDHEDIVTSIINAPTGAAAFNSNGKTCHNTWKIPIRKQYNLSDEKAALMRQELQRVLFLCIDERSMLSKGILGAINRNAQKTVHNNTLQTTKSFGGIPIVLLTGDDHQLPSVTIGEEGQGITYFFNTTKQKRRKNSCRDSQQQVLENEGQEIFFRCAEKVIELETIKRLEADAEDLKNILSDLRNDGIKECDVQKLLQLHIRNLPTNQRNQIENDAVYLFATKDLKSQHNMKKLNEITTDNNPVCLLQTKFLKRSTQKWEGIRNHFDADSIPKKTLLAKHAKVAISGRNFQPNWGLYNGALGTIVGFKFSSGKNPQTDHLPEYVVVDFPSYSGPPWISDKPTLVPIPIVKVPCKKGCCEAHFVPLVLAFARTIHTFQGMEAGPSKQIKQIVVDVGKAQFEAINPGVLYTALSRASTIGKNQQQSAIYFSGPLTKDRLMNVKYKRNCYGKKQLYEKVQMRNKWVEYLLYRKQNTPEITDIEKASLKRWLQCTNLLVHQLDSIITYHRNATWIENTPDIPQKT